MIKKLLLTLAVLITLASVYLFINLPNKPKLTIDTQKNVQINSSKSSSSTYVVLGDTGTGNQNQHNVASSIINYCNEQKDCKAAFIVGDIIYPDGVKDVNDPQFNSKFEKPYQNINLPIYIILGNHDYRGCVQCYIKYSEKSSKWKMPSTYYKESFGNITFYAIDTENFNNDQQKWLEKKLETDTSRWKIVLGHKPLKSYEVGKENDSWNGINKLKEIICTNTNFYISGHSHILEDVGVIDNCKVRQLISGGGGASTRKVTKPYPGIFYHEGHGFIALKIENNNIQTDYVDTNGDSLYKF